MSKSTLIQKSQILDQFKKRFWLETKTKQTNKDLN